MAEVAQAVVALIPSARGFGQAISREVGGDLVTAGQSGGEQYAKGMKGRVGSLAKGVVAPLAGVMAGIGIKDFLGDSLGEARESQKVSALTEQIIKSTGGAAKVTSEQVGALAESISKKAGVDDEAVQSAANLLLTFKQVRNEAGKNNDVFNRATRASQDLAAAGFGDANSSAKMLGKALNDPIKGMSALSRAGVTFTEQQKAQVKALQSGGLDNAFSAMGESVTNKQLETLAKDEFGGDIAKAVDYLQEGWTEAQKKRFDYYAEGGHQLDAQKVILKEVEGQVGGAAEATATAGEKAGVALGNLKEQVGTALIPVMDRLSTTFTEKIAPAVSTFIEEMQAGEGTGGRVREIFERLGSALQNTGSFLNDHRREVAYLLAAYAGFKAVQTTMRAYNAVVAAGKAVMLGYRAATYGAVGATYAQSRAEKVGLVVGKAKLAITKAQTIAQRVLNAVMNMSPMGKVILAITALVAGLALLYKKNKTFRDFINKLWASIKGAVGRVVEWFRSTALPWMRDALTKIGAVASRLWTNHIRPAFTKIKSIAASVFGWIRNTGLPWVRTAIGAIGKVVAWLWTNVYKRYFTFILSKVKSVFGWIKDTAVPNMRRAFSAIGTAVSNVWTKWIKPGFDRIKKGVSAVKDAFSSAKSGIAKIWGGLKGALIGPITAALEWVDKNFLSKVRAVLNAVGAGDLAKKIPSLRVPTSDGAGGNRGGRQMGGPQQFARGGWTGPGSTFQPAGVVHADEFVVKKTSRQRFERNNPGVLDHINRTGRMPGYAIGGKVAGLNKKFYEQLSAFNAAAGGKYSVYSGYRSIAEQQVLYNRYLSGNGPVAARPGGSQHNFGLAADLSPSNARVDADLARRFGLVFTVPSESWHIEPTWGRKGGAGGGVVGGGGGGFLSGLAAKVFDKGKSVLNGIIDKLPKSLGFWGGVGAGAMKMAVPAIFEKFKGAADLMGATSGDGTGGTGGFVSKATGSNVDMGRRMAAAAGWTGNQWLALKELWTRESNWNHLAKNPSSGAYGIPQSLPGSKMRSSGADYLTNPATQIDWGLKYIRERYGNPSGALQWHNSHNWYAGGGRVSEPVKPLLFDSGGYLPPGVSVVSNQTRRPEPLMRMNGPGAGGAGGTAVFKLYDSDGVLMGSMRGVADTSVARGQNFDRVTDRMGVRR